MKLKGRYSAHVVYYSHDCDTHHKPILFTEQTRKRAFILVAQAYSSITGDDFAAFVGMPVNEAVDGMLTDCAHYLVRIENTANKCESIW